VHRGSRDDTGVDQRLRALLALDQDHGVCLRDAGLVVQRARLWRRQLAALRIPRPEFLLAARRVVAVHHRDQLAIGVEVVPLGGRRPKVVYRRRPLGFRRRHCGDTPKQPTRFVQNARKLGVHIDTEVPCNQCIHIPTGVVGAISPQPSLLAGQHDLQAVAGATENIADQKPSTAHFSCRVHHSEHRLQTFEQLNAELFSFFTMVAGHRCLRCVIEVHEPMRHCVCSSPSRALNHSPLARTQKYSRPGPA